MFDSIVTILQYSLQEVWRDVNKVSYYLMPCLVEATWRVGTSEKFAIVLGEIYEHFCEMDEKVFHLSRLALYMTKQCWEIRAKRNLNI